jgi:hypothetical protein
MKFWSRGTALWFILCFIFIYLVDLFTISPNVISGNGNLGLVFVVPALIVFLLLARSLWRALGKLELDSNTWMKIGMGALVLFVAFGFLEYKFFLNLINDLGGSSEIETSRIYRYPMLNQYTNTIFVNFYTLVMVITGVILLRWFFRRK